jgi:phosphoribosylanthranilate isomerase
VDIMGLRVKICGITQPDQGRAIAELGATALGFICAPTSPRYVAPEQIRAVVDHLPQSATGAPTVDRVGVFVDSTLAEIQQTVTIGQLNAVQLHGTESPEFCFRVRSALPSIEIIKALRIRVPAALSQADFYDGWVDALLLDAYHPDQAGGTGMTLDWPQLTNFRPSCPWLLAGGLNPANISAALALVKPDGIDLSSGVETAPGDKDLAKVAQLFQQLAGSFKLQT